MTFLEDGIQLSDGTFLTHADLMKIKEYISFVPPAQLSAEEIECQELFPEYPLNDVGLIGSVSSLQKVFYAQEGFSTRTITVIHKVNPVKLFHAHRAELEDLRCFGPKCWTEIVNWRERIQASADLSRAEGIMTLTDFLDVEV